MHNCPYCNPEENGRRETVIPILDTIHSTICVIGFTPIGNRRKTGSLQILDKHSGEVTYTDIKRCPMCGQLLYVDEFNF